MPSRKAYDIVTVTGEYKDRDGNTKKRYINLGVIIEHDDGGLSLIMESIPVGWTGKAYLYKPKSKDGGEAKTSVPEGVSDEIPF